MPNTVFINADPSDDVYSSFNNKGYLICMLDEKNPHISIYPKI